ncbi:hypothetical protein PENARI_c189G06700 [Penicillium arizonense]|uniref:Uncharacterized protein n=1 Tax=Penicillium arizonense TaxID=1835702 RepID=A0A1F5L011_PENAI|nr:hypothetical protein PENARI_c190G02893 [Penicillium arizonense]XP_022482033.1 hypothetical protein PENARI_c189G06700 [Penicillium arizonense]OGE46563.1 hypothetical protein PENARI_c190G02893 [Penicillium arizonense]OGE46564.1 hypothetical protein PENARI_c189G06700 [Penicillium arizonense]
MTTLSLGKIDESEEVAAVDAAAATDTWPDVASCPFEEIYGFCSSLRLPGRCESKADHFDTLQPTQNVVGFLLEQKAPSRGANGSETPVQLKFSVEYMKHWPS